MAKKFDETEVKELWTKVDDYITDLFALTDPALDATLDSSTSAGLPPIQVAPNQGKLLMLLAQLMGAKRILEIGTLGGYSTIWLARALPADGFLISLEAEPKHAEVARENIARAGLKNKVEVRTGRAIKSLPKLLEEKQPPFDLIFIDADKEGYPEYFVWALKLSRKGTLIIADNIVREGEVANSTSEDSRVIGARKFNDLVAAEPRVSGTVIQTVGAKGYDGVTVVLVTK